MNGDGVEKRGGERGMSGGLSRTERTQRRFERAMRLTVSRGRRWDLAGLCEAVDLVVDLQQLALADRATYSELVGRWRCTVRLWLYELILAAGALGFDEVGTTLCDALVEVDMRPYHGLLRELALLDASEAMAATAGGAA